MITLHTANRYETLRARLLADMAARPLSDPFAKRQVIVPSVAIKRDLQRAVSRETGICTLLECPFLAQWLWEQIGRFVPVPDVSPFSAQRLSWRLYRIFSDADFVGKHSRLKDFLGLADPVMQFELAERVASLFEQLLTYRPEWLDAWSQGKAANIAATHHAKADEAWQAALWQRLVGDLGIDRQHPASRFFDLIESTEHAAKTLPDSVQIFALSTIPPLYLHMLDRLSTHLDIHLYLLNPCTEFWFDIVDRKRLKRLAARQQADFHETGNRLLASWGKQTQSMLGLIFEQSHVLEETADFTPPPQDTLLGQLQSAILNLHELPADPACPTNDRSVEVHVCHSLFRELEVLHDRLLALQAELPKLHADEILVAVPDMETAAPLIDAVFGTRGHLPYTVTGRPVTQNHPVVRSLLAVIDAAHPQLPASQGLALLRDPLIARRLGFSEDTAEWLSDALQQAGLHWGLHDGRHSWPDALSRLLLAYACPADDTAAKHSPFVGQLPADVAVHGSQAKTLGLLWRLLEQLKALSQQLAHPHTAAQWQQIWLDVLASFLAPNEDQLEEARAVRETLSELASAMSEGDHATLFAMPLARKALEKALAAAPRGGVPGNAITFAPLASLRNLPFRVICVLGLNDGVFPSPQRPLEFDLMAAQYRPGDRQRQTDERNLFLDLLLSARDIFHLSYTGRSQVDDSLLPPSIVLSELLETLADTASTKAKNLAQRCLVQHPLHAFSRRYFDPQQDPRLISFDEAIQAAWQIPPAIPKPSDTPQLTTSLDDETDAGNEENDDSARADRPQPLFFKEPLPSSPTSANTTRNIHLADLQSFFRHPARYLLRQVLGIQLQEQHDDIKDTEPQLLERPAQWQLSHRILPHAIHLARVHTDSTTLRHLALAGIEIPDGGIGLAQAQALIDGLDDFAQAVCQHQHPAPTPLIQGAITLTPDSTPTTLHLQLRGVQPEHPIGLLRYRYSPMSAGDLITAWLDHLALCALQPEGVTLRTTHLGCAQKNGMPQIEPITFRPVENPAALLQVWVEAFMDGQRQPLPLPPRTAWAWFSADPGKQDNAARAAWHNLYEQRGEALDPWWQLAWRGQLNTPALIGSPLFLKVKTLATTLFLPMREHLETPLSADEGE